jgi:hypothetical protein
MGLKQTPNIHTLERGSNMSKVRVFQKPPVPAMIAKEIQVRSNGKFTGEKVVVLVPNPSHRPATMDGVALGNLHHFPGVGFRGVREDRAPNSRNNAYIPRQKSSRVRRNFGDLGKVAQVKGNAASFATATPAKQTVMALRLKAMGPEDEFVGQAAKAEMQARKDNALLLKEMLIS